MVQSWLIVSFVGFFFSNKAMELTEKLEKELCTLEAVEAQADSGYVKLVPTEFVK